MALLGEDSEREWVGVRLWDAVNVQFLICAGYIGVITMKMNQIYLKKKFLEWKIQ